MCDTQYKGDAVSQGVHMNQKEEIAAGLAMELRRGTIVLCVLSQLQEPMYGYNLGSVLAEGGVPVETNTLYPLLRRLEKQGLLISSWEMSASKPRKYYQITELGMEIYQNLKQQWEDTARHMTILLG